jgi:hypothetical protein
LRSSLLVAALVLAPGAAHAFADASQFFNPDPQKFPATVGASGDGLYFTGAPRFASLGCSTCHTDGPQKVGLQLNAVETSLFTDGYVPGHTYELQVQLTNEVEGLTWNTKTCTDPPAPGDTYQYVQCNNNGFGLEIDDSTGAPLSPMTSMSMLCPQMPAGGTCPMPDFTRDDAIVAPGGDAIFGAKVYGDPNNPKTVSDNGATSWTFYWTAPKAGTGPLTVYVSAVDGNGGAGNANNDQDPYNDDTVSANFFLQEANAAVNDRASAGCSLGARAGTPGPVWFLLVLGALVRAASRRGRPSSARCRA